MHKRTTPALLAATALMGTASVAMAADLPSREEMWKMLQQQQQEINGLRQELQSQKSAPAPQQAAPPPQAAPQAAEAGKEPPKKEGLNWSDRITLSGAVDVRANTVETFKNAATSDVVIDTVKLGIDVKIADMVTGRIVFLHEEPYNAPDTAFVDVDEATITLGDTERQPLYLTAGRKTVPFGKFTTNLISDPLTMQLGETKESVLEVGFQHKGGYGSVYAFNGNAQKAGGNDTIDQFGANLGYGGKIREVTFDFGGSLINSLEDSEVLTSRIATVNAMQQHIGGAGLHAQVGFSGFTLIGEYITALDRFAPTELAWNGGGAKPSAWNLEAGYGFTMMGKETTIAGAWQGSEEALGLGGGLGFPENRLMVGFSMGIYDHTTLAMEWMHDKDYNTTDISTAPGTNNTANTGTVKLAVEF
ncbi:MAG: LbtU family siderophore porin [Magnetococcales bacterium]|nr:LbtU family siderophore porin [Magnetococcales bacterium]